MAAVAKPDSGGETSNSESEADFPGHEALVNQHLQLLVESSKASDVEHQQPDLLEQQMLLKLLVSEQETMRNQSSSVREHRRRRFPFLYSRRKVSRDHGVQQAEYDEDEDFGAVDDAKLRLAEVDEESQKEQDSSTSQSTSELQPPPPSGPANQSNAQLDEPIVGSRWEQRQGLTTVFTNETMESQGGWGGVGVSGRSRGSGIRDMSSMFSESVGNSSKQMERHQSLVVSNLMVWHRYSEIPFDITSSEFTVKTPVLPLVQGGHLVFLMSKCNQSTHHYSVKIIKKANSSFGGASRMKRRHSITNQTAIINKDEFLVLKKLAHPFVAMLLYFCENQSLYYYFFPQYVLANLATNVSMYMRIDVKACVYVTCCIINAVEYLYRNCIVHRDISSKCVLFNADFKPVLFHFDYATFYGTMQSSDARLTFLPELASRAPEVISPEISRVCEPEHYVNCDIWGVGVLLGELLLNTLVMMRALKRKLDLHWVFSVREGGPDDTGIGRSHPTVPKDLMEVLRMCLRKFPQDRPTIYTLMQHPTFLKYDVSNVNTIHCKPSPLISEFHRLL
ncbi:hypothetical protein BOX15_Mlig033045g1 [Macrostomum lignano]|uniref:Protein kinase domain-containing protein n=1 Tax=Macrostomum lignano TaxID=282301 RepID=A0A267GMM3_9PLAT|nr:hypothetical protein BOX15_Mlig033045g1 [Macrostomum lignano]